MMLRHGWGCGLLQGMQRPCTAAGRCGVANILAECGPLWQPQQRQTWRLLCVAAGRRGGRLRRPAFGRLRCSGRRRLLCAAAGRRGGRLRRRWWLRCWLLQAARGRRCLLWTPNHCWLGRRPRRHWRRRRRPCLRKQLTGECSLRRRWRPWLILMLRRWWQRCRLHSLLQAARGRRLLLWMYRRKDDCVIDAVRLVSETLEEHHHGKFFLWSLLQYLPNCTHPWVLPGSSLKRLYPMVAAQPPGPCRQ